MMSVTVTFDEDELKVLNEALEYAASSGVLYPWELDVLKMKLNTEERGKEDKND